MHIFADHATLQLGRPNPVSLYVDDIIDSPGDLVVSVLVSQRPVSTEVETGIRAVVGIEELLVVSVDGPSHSRPGSLHTKVTTDVWTRQLFALNVVL